MSTSAHAALALLLVSVFSTAFAEDAYRATVEQRRALIDRLFRDPAVSPLPTGDLRRFDGLRYFEIEPSLRLPATFQPAARGAPFHLPMSDGSTTALTVHGYLDFTLTGERQRLIVYRQEDASGPRALVPFRDLSNGSTTYAGGRYLRLPLPLVAPIKVDFNLAENPRCAYDPRFACPLPPIQNGLALEISAGEKAYD